MDFNSVTAPTRSVWTLSSGSEASLDDLVRDNDDDEEDEVSLSKLFKKDGKTGNDAMKKMPGSKRKRQDLDLEKQEVVKGNDNKKSNPQLNHSLWMLSSDSESYSDDSLQIKHSQEELDEYDPVQQVEEGENEVAVLRKNEKHPHGMDSRMKSPKKQLKKDFQSKNEKEENKVVIEECDDEMNIQEEDTTEKKRRQVSSSRLPLVLPEKVLRTKALVECEGDSIDLSGDVGAVGRLMISDAPSGDHYMFLDLKGAIYKTTIVPSRTFCVLRFGQSEAKIEAIMNDFIQLKPQSDVYDAETTVEGTLEGFSFDSEEEPDHPRNVTVQNGKDEPGDEQPKHKGKNKSKVEKAKAARGKPPKKFKKTQAIRKSKIKK